MARARLRRLGDRLTETLEIHRAFSSPFDHEWDDLADRVNASPFLRPGWFTTWWSAFGTGALEIHGVRRDGNLVGVAPMTRRGPRLTSPTNAESPEFGFLAADQDAAQTLAGSVLAGRPAAILVTKSSAGGPEMDALRRSADLLGFKATVTTMQRSPYLEIEGTWSDLEASISKSFRQTVKRRWRGLERAGRLDIETLDGSSGLAEALDEGFAVEPSEWKAAAGTAIASNPRTEMFYRDMAAWAARRGWLRLVFMRLDGKAIAFRLDLQTTDALFHVKGGFDTAYSKFSPGNVLQYWTVERAFEAKLKRYEFLGADERHKTVWTPLTHERIALGLFAPSARGRLGFGLETRAKPLAKSLLRKLGDLRSR